MKPKIKKTIVIHQGALGDMVCTVPAIAALKSESKLVIGVGSSRLKLLEYAGILDQAVLSEAIGFHRLFLDNFDPGPGLKSIFEGAEIAVSWLGRKAGPFQKNLESLAGKVSIFREQFPPPAASPLGRCPALFMFAGFWPGPCLISALRLQILRPN